ncbi:MAG: hypothetical protein IPO78_12390 [Saprospiraceae bacterium]|nr:hypothetical protein [Saprospiraceae bacterium]MBK8451287.1 hypothetical protein [Saprospiraceae bacterium]MBK9220758.1 hypothetical protein [Saprospiraceae bacterium]MBK9722397.1 hypothetical protein [Saprospiraceae bacterium]
MDLMSILINSIAGAAGGWLTNMLKQNGLGAVGNLIAGAAGGNILPIITTALGLFANTSSADGGGINIIGIIVSLLGGGAGSLIGGLFKKAA